MLASFSFTDEKIFTVTTPKNSQNDRLYAHPSTKIKDVATKRLRIQLTFSLRVTQVVDITTVRHFHHGVKVTEEY